MNKYGHWIHSFYPKPNLIIALILRVTQPTRAQALVEFVCALVKLVNSQAQM